MDDNVDEGAWPPVPPVDGTTDLVDAVTLGSFDLSAAPAPVQAAASGVLPLAQAAVSSIAPGAAQQIVLRKLLEAQEILVRTELGGST